MVAVNESKCPICGGELVGYDTVERTVITKKRITYKILLLRRKCKICNKIHTELPEDIIPYKRYEAEMIYGVIEGYITPFVIGFEDYPCEATMQRWLSQKEQLLLWRNPK